MNLFVKVVLIHLLLIISQFFYEYAFAQAIGADDLMKAKCQLDSTLKGCNNYNDYNDKETYDGINDPNFVPYNSTESKYNESADFCEPHKKRLLQGFRMDKDIRERCSEYFKTIGFYPDAYGCDPYKKSLLEGRPEIESYEDGCREYFEAIGFNKEREDMEEQRKAAAEKRKKELEKAKKAEEKKLKELRKLRKAEEERKKKSEARELAKQKKAEEIRSIKTSKFYEGPSSQIYFLDLVFETLNSISPDTTQAKRKWTWIQANKKLCSSSLFDALALKKDWIGYVETIVMQDDGDLILEVDIDDFGNEVRDSSVNEKLIDFVVNLKAEQGFKKKSGDLVRFSGFFVRGKGSENECIRAGFDANPEITNEELKFEFTDIKIAD